jgi:hypothetical protein
VPVEHSVEEVTWAIPSSYIPFSTPPRREEKYTLVRHKGEYLYILAELWEANRPAIGLYQSRDRAEYHFVVLTAKGSVVGFSVTERMMQVLAAGGTNVEQFRKELNEIKLGEYAETILEMIEDQHGIAPEAYDPSKNEEIPEDWELDEEELGDPVPIPSV